MTKEMRGECIGCQKSIAEDDATFDYSSGEIACVDCAPTWKAARDEWEEQKDDDAEGYAAFVASYDKHIAGGGSLGAKCVWKEESQ